MTASCINLIKMFHLKCINSCVSHSFHRLIFILCYITSEEIKKYYWLQIIIKVFTLNIISVMKIIIIFLLHLFSNLQSTIKYTLFPVLIKNNFIN